MALFSLLVQPVVKLVPAAPALAAGAIYVDPVAGNDANSGMVGNPYRTLQKALQVVQPGATVRLASGVYQEANHTVTAGTASAPIVIEPAEGALPVLDGKRRTLNAIRIIHSFYTVRNLEIRNVKEGVRIEGASGVVLENNKIHHVSNEGLRLRYFSRGNIVKNNAIWATGLSGNGEGIYLGTAPEQRYKNGGKPDTSTWNIITGNEIYNVTEGIDIKEDSSFNTVSGNVIHNNTDPQSGGINVRADANYLYNNVSFNNAGAGYRFGGDVTYSPEFGDNYRYGVNNVLRNNVARNNRGYGYKFMNGPQYSDASNTGAANGGVLRYHGSGVAPCTAQAPPAPPPALALSPGVALPPVVPTVTSSLVPASTIAPSSRQVGTASPAVQSPASATPPRRWDLVSLNAGLAGGFLAPVLSYVVDALAAGGSQGTEMTNDEGMTVTVPPA
ncbi:MAG: right-handed parallel beta-helix repeat-containing protein [Chloroflexi bacterium]|nr:right-handed parallel beta-helix repeat-containing protein [Chloroflexota bacterium]